jgi:hypothetical protein
MCLPLLDGAQSLGIRSVLLDCYIQFLRNIHFLRPLD